jgi:hypothetical protein
MNKVTIDREDAARIVEGVLGRMRVGELFRRAVPNGRGVLAQWVGKHTQRCEVQIDLARDGEDAKRFRERARQVLKAAHTQTCFVKMRGW